MRNDQRAVENMLHQVRRSFIAKISAAKRKIMENEGQEAMGSGREVGDCSAFHATSHLTICHMESCRDVLSQVENAIERLRGGSYGYCALCEDFIGMGRLRFLPFAVHCRDCQEEMEHGKNPRHRQLAVGL